MSDPRDWTPTVHYANFMPPDAEAWAHRRLTSHELILAVAGRFVLTLHDTDEDIVQRAGELVWIRPGEHHTYRVDPGGRNPFFACVHFFLREGAAAGPRHVDATPMLDLMVDRFRRLPIEWNGVGRFRQALCDQLLKEILLRTADLADRPTAGHPGRLRDMLAYIDAHLTEHPGRGDLSRAFSLSPSYVSRLFRTQVGETPTAYVHRRLAHRGYTMLFGGSCSVKEAAYALGFSNPFHFSRVFKAVYGLSPAQVTAARPFAQR